MSRYSKIDKWILILLSITFVLIDWNAHGIAISDITLMFIMLLLIFKVKITVTQKQILLYIGVLFLVISNIGLNLLFNAEFLFNDGIKGLLKVFFYMTVTIVLYNYIVSQKLQFKLIKVLSITAVVVSVIGIYISIAIYLKGILPYEFFWKFTRMDFESYMYRGWGRSIIRARSIFAEPAHLGFYLNSILGIFYFNKLKYEIDKRVDTIITLTILLTFSFSAILIMITIKVLYYANPKTIRSFFADKRYIISLIVLIIIVIMMWETIDKTIIIRAREILSGADKSGTVRLQGSWDFINKEHIFMGNGIGNTPTIWNIYAYILSDLGLVSFIAFIIFNITLLLTNLPMGALVVMQGFQKGGYLGAGYWVFMLLVILCLDKIKPGKKLIV